MRNRMYAIKNHQIVDEIDVAPFSDLKMDIFCREKGYDDWFELDDEGALKLIRVEKAETP